MSISINKVELLGRVGRDPEVRYMPDGKAVASLRLATSESWKDKNGDWQEKTEWHSVTSFGKLAEVIGEHVTKGRELYVVGKIQTRQWQDKDGNDRYTTEIVASEIKFGAKPEGAKEQGNDKPRREPPPRASMPDDDIPFFDDLGRRLWRVV